MRPPTSCKRNSALAKKLYCLNLSALRRCFPAAAIRLSNCAIRPSQRELARDSSGQAKGIAGGARLPRPPRYSSRTGIGREIDCAFSALAKTKGGGLWRPKSPATAAASARQTTHSDFPWWGTAGFDGVSFAFWPWQGISAKATSCPPAPVTTRQNERATGLASSARVTSTDNTQRWRRKRLMSQRSEGGIRLSTDYQCSLEYCACRVLLAHQFPQSTIENISLSIRESGSTGQDTVNSVCFARPAAGFCSVIVALSGADSLSLEFDIDTPSFCKDERALVGGARGKCLLQSH